ncbi:MAG: hypothetical protein J0M29_02850 [Chitinophagales bacterium]|nr:hypothetical protein [Chitinophagales bacterium]
MKNLKYTGYHASDYQASYGMFYSENIPAPTDQVIKAMANALPAGALPDLAQAVEALQWAVVQDTEYGFTREPDGAIRVALRTPMPGVTPAMVHWWFGWHSLEDNRYKLWHPRAHQSARWRDGCSEVSYVGRVSAIEEYIGTTLEKADIQFVAPEKLGLPAFDPTNPKSVLYVCARVGLSIAPLDAGWLIHQVRPVAGGAEMRSRFWMGGRYVAWRGAGWLAGILNPLLPLLAKLPAQQARDLLTHCSEEMQHLSGFLPALYLKNNPA